jgi:hypothetical protein
VPENLGVLFRARIRCTGTFTEKMCYSLAKTKVSTDQTSQQLEYLHSVDLR